MASAKDEKTYWNSPRYHGGESAISEFNGLLLLQVRWKVLKHLLGGLRVIKIKLLRLIADSVGRLPLPEQLLVLHIANINAQRSYRNFVNVCGRGSSATISTVRPVPPA